MSVLIKIVAWIVYPPLILAATGLMTAWLATATGLTWLAAYLVTMNVVAFVFYGWDKFVSWLRGAIALLNYLIPRIPTQVMLWGLEFPGGTLGAVMCMWLCRHKIGDDEDEFRLRFLRVFGIQAFILLALILVTVLLGTGWIDLANRLIETASWLVVDVVNTVLEWIWE